ncbi:MAG: sigma-70 family RNA polymerase sigma factor [Polaribacter sp.]|nr:sigma-70 family RNA polymerase sigma factor [Polaribacter sp.]
MKPTKQLHQEVIEQCKNNNAKSQIQLYNLYCKAMFLVAKRIVNDTFLAEEVMQKAFIKAFKNIDTYKNEVAFGAWLKKIVVNQSIDELKKKKFDFVDVNEKVIVAIDDEDWQVEDSISIEDVKNAMTKLKEKYKLVVTLYLIEGYDHQEISEILNITENTSRTHLLRGKIELKELLQKEKYVTRY